MSVEDEYFDVLQNIEFGIVNVYKNNPDLADHNVMRILEALIDTYIAEKIGRSPRNFNLSEIEFTLRDSVFSMCEFRLGRQAMTDSQKIKQKDIYPLTVDEIVLCLKRILKSVKKWNKHGGRQGYLNFIIQYFH